MSAFPKSDLARVSSDAAGRPFLPARPSKEIEKWTPTIALVQLPFAAPHNVCLWHKADIAIALAILGE